MSKGNWFQKKTFWLLEILGLAPPDYQSKLRPVPVKVRAKLSRL
jgi:hypothetical protein